MNTQFKKGMTPWNKGKKRPPFSAEWRKKLGDAQKGDKHYLYGKEMPLKTRQKISETRLKLKIKQSDETKKKIGDAQRGEKNASKRPEVRLKISENLRGNKHPQWKGGKTELSDRIRDCFLYRQWRDDVFTRDNFSCKECGLKGGYLEADHIKQFALILVENSISSVEQAMQCSELWNINNGRTLCKMCHLKTGTHGKRISLYVVS